MLDRLPGSNICTYIQYRITGFDYWKNKSWLVPVFSKAGDLPRGGHLDPQLDVRPGQPGERKHWYLYPNLQPQSESLVPSPQPTS